MCSGEHERRTAPGGIASSIAVTAALDALKDAEIMGEVIDSGREESRREEHTTTPCLSRGGSPVYKAATSDSLAAASRAGR